MPRTLTHDTLAGQIEAALRADIIEGLLQPGERLRVQDLTARYGVSATPLREALQRLSAQNLVDLDPRYGATVGRVSAEDLRDTYWLLEHLQGLAIEGSLPAGDIGWEENLRRAWDKFRDVLGLQQSNEPENIAALSEAHAGFHTALLAACGSPWLLRFIETLSDHAERYRLLSAPTAKPYSLADHAAIFEHALARDMSATVRAQASHLARTVDIVEGLRFSAPPASDGMGEKPPTTEELLSASVSVP